MDAWDKLRVLKEHPELADDSGYELKNLYAEADPVYWFLLLMEQPQFAPPHEWWFSLRHRSDLPWARLLAVQPQFEGHCHWNSVGRGELVKLAFIAPDLFARKFPHGHWHDLYAFLTPMELAGVLCDVPQVAELLDMEDVAKRLAPDRWLTVIASQPRLEKYFDWGLVEKKSSIFWDDLLRHQPQFACHCDFSLLKNNQICRILKRQPQLGKRIKKTMDRKYKTYVAMLHEWPWEQAQHYLEKQISSGKDYTVHEWIDIIEHHPEAADHFVPWKDYTPEKWAVFLGRMPQFADQCPCFDQFLPKQWSQILAAHPELESRGVCFDQFTEENWKDLCNRNTDFFMHRENWTLRDELRPAFFLRDYLIKRKRLLIDLQTAANICDDNNKKYQIIGVDTDIGRPRTWEFKKEEIDRILAPFRHEQKAVYNFLSSGNTNGILSKTAEELAQELPIHNRNDLENLIAIAQPGPWMYWEAYKENRPCRLAMASEITKRTRGVLLYAEQQKQAIQLLTGCSPEEAVMLWAKNISERLNRPYKELFLHLIADYNGITREKAEELHNAWHSYGPYSVRYDRIKKKAHSVYLRALDYLRKNGTKGVKDRKYIAPR